MNFYSRNIPLELKDRKQWVGYFKRPMSDGHVGKIMVSPNTYRHARSNVPSDWANFYKAYLFSSDYGKMDGLAFVLTEGIVFIDIDHSIDEKGKLSPLAEKLLHEFPLTYAERSCSGHGVHILLKGKLPEGCMKRNDEIGLEMYDTKRFCCLTGDIISQSKEIYDYGEKLHSVALKLLGRKEVSPIPQRHYSQLNLGDEEIIRKALHSKSGDKFSRLYSGDFSAYPSQSSADLALVSMIAFYTQNPEQIDRIFRNSGLYREKWDSPRGDSTYGRMTIETSLANTKRVYSMQ